VKFQHGLLLQGIGVLFLANHSGVGLEVGSVVPRVHLDSVVKGLASEHVSEGDASETSIPVEHLSSLLSGFDVREVVDPSLVGHNGHTTLVVSHSAADTHSKGIGNNSADDPVEDKVVLVGTSELTGVFPWNSLGASCVLAETVCEPGVAAKVFSQEGHVIVFLLLCGHTRRAHLKNSVGLAKSLVLDLVFFTVVDGSRVVVVIGVVEMAGHRTNGSPVFFI